MTSMAMACFFGSAPDDNRHRINPGMMQNGVHLLLFPCKTPRFFIKITHRAPAKEAPSRRSAQASCLIRNGKAVVVLMLARIDIGNLKSLRCVIAVANQSPYESRQRRRHGDSHRFSNRHSVRSRNIRQDSQRLSFFYAVTNADQAIDETCCFTCG